MAEDFVMEMQWRNAAYNPDGTIDCEILLGGEWLPFTASPDDVEPHGVELFYALKDILDVRS